MFQRCFVTVKNGGKKFEGNKEFVRGQIFIGITNIKGVELSLSDIIINGVSRSFVEDSLPIIVNLEGMPERISSKVREVMESAFLWVYDGKKMDIKIREDPEFLDCAMCCRTTSRVITE